MLSRHRVSRAAIELIKRFEGCRQKSVQLPDGRWMIGHGHTLTAREGAEVSPADAEALLVYDLIAVQHAVNESLYAPVTQNQFDALCSFAMNIGLDNFRRSQVLKRLNAGAAVQAACAMELWRKADFEGEKIVVDALVRRRAAEKALFLTPDGGDWAAAPSPMLRPLIDLDALDLVPMRRPVAVAAEQAGEALALRRTDEADAESAVASPESEPAPEPTPAMTAAAEAVARRLEQLFPDPGAEPDAVALSAMEAEEEEEEEEAPAVLPEEPPLLEEPRPQADFAPPITPDVAPLPDAELFAEPEPEPEPEPGPEPEPERDPELLDLDLFSPPPPTPAPEEDLAIPAAPQGLPDHLAARVEMDAAPFDLIPARRRPAPAPREPSVIWDLLLALFGLAFFGFGLFWGLEARPVEIAGIPMTLLVAWTAGLAGVGFVTISVYRLLQRLGREIEAD